MSDLPTKDRITIIIVSFESENRIRDSVSSIPEDIRVILVDNASLDNTIAVAKAARPSIEMIELDQNIGFGRANNRGIALVKTDYVLLQNPDAYLKQDTLDVAVKIFDANLNIGALGIGKKSRHETDLTDIDAIGGAMFFRMETLNKVGFFDENIFLYAEDAEICWRIAKNGYRVCTSNRIQVDHKGNDSVKMDNIDAVKDFIHGQSRAYLLMKQNGRFLGSILIFLKAHRSVPYSFLFRKTFQKKNERRKGMMDYLKRGNMSLFDNELARRVKP